MPLQQVLLSNLHVVIIIVYNESI